MRKLSRVEYATVATELTEKSDAVRESIADLADATAHSIEPVKSTISRRLDDFERALDAAGKRG